MNDVTGGAGDYLPDHETRRRDREVHARLLPMGPSLRDLLRPLDGGWYTECLKCGLDLSTPGVTYYAERAFRDDEPLFEYALCDSCVFGFQDEFSPRSMETVQDFWERHIDRRARFARVTSTRDGDDLVERCLLSGVPRAELVEIQAWAWCRDEQILLDFDTPAFASGAIIGEVAELLSRETRDALDDFIREHLGLPPELRNLPLL